VSLSDSERERLEAERDFLLRSLDDLDREHADDGIDAETFAVLHADYTARAAQVTRRLAGRPVDERAETRSDPRWGLTALALGIILLTVTLGAILFAAPRGTDGSLTGNDPDSPTSTDSQAALEAERARLTAAVGADPEDFDARLDLGLFLFQQRAYVEATKHLAVAQQLRPDDVEAQSFYGWVVWQAAQQSPEGPDRNELISIALEHLEIAVGIDPEDPGANTFYGIALLRGKGDASAAIPYLERAVTLAGDQAPPMLSEALAEARATVAGSTTTSTAPTSVGEPTETSTTATPTSEG
jgi:cytochrome c-type biogenesis protein CcmH/NrfG